MRPSCTKKKNQPRTFSREVQKKSGVRSHNSICLHPSVEFVPLFGHNTHVFLVSTGVSIAPFQGVYPGSSPGRGIILFDVCSPTPRSPTFANEIQRRHCVMAARWYFKRTHCHFHALRDVSKLLRSHTQVIFLSHCSFCSCFLENSQGLAYVDRRLAGSRGVCNERPTPAPGVMVQQPVVLSPAPYFEGQQPYYPGQPAPMTVIAAPLPPPPPATIVVVQETVRTETASKTVRLCCRALRGLGCSGKSDANDMVTLIAVVALVISLVCGLSIVCTAVRKDINWKPHYQQTTVTYGTNQLLRSPCCS
jgi:hypothetical protein